MRQKLYLGTRQQLKMTPQLQQAIRLLQLSTLELSQEIQENLYSNPLLEVDEDPGEPNPGNNDTTAETGETRTEDTRGADRAQAADAEYFSLRRQGSAPNDESRETERSSVQSLHDYLDWQLGLSHITQADLRIGQAIIDAIDDDGLLRENLDDIAIAADLDEPPDTDEIEAVLTRIQHFDPPGVGARDLRECMLLQLTSMNESSPEFELACKVAEKFLPLVSKGDLRQLKRQLRCSEAEISRALDILKNLSPRPGAGYGQEEVDFITPDVVVKKIKGQWVVSLNPETLPKIRLTREYTEYLDDAEGESRQYLKNKIQEAKWFLRSLESRHDTLLKVAKSIVLRQMNFFNSGPEHMKPLVLRDLAEELGFHESTISRATNQKYLSCPAGVFELKYFFSSQVATTEGGEASSTATKALISKLISTEDAQKPLSDSKLASLLKEQGIVVARRTVAKYREMQGIKSSSARRRIC